MIDNNDNSDEYTFPEEEFMQGEAPGKPVGAEPEAEVAAKARDAYREKVLAIVAKVREILSNRIVAAVLIVIILLVVVHFFVGSSFSSKPKAAAPIIRSTPTVGIQQPQQPSQAVMSQLSGVKASASNLRTQISQLQTQVQQMQASLTQVTQNRDGSQAALLQLAHEVNQLTAAQKVKVKQPSVHQRVAIIPPIVFHTRAVVHNRAWLVGSNGSNPSVSVGTHLPQYGRVLSIDADTGTIQTSSGRVIHFALSDS